MNPVIGIDLGTTNTVVAHADGGRAVTLADTNGEKLIPSIVSFHPNGQVLTGATARERRLVDAANTISSIKRLIGRTWNSEEVRKARGRFPFELREGPGQGVLVFARGQTYTLPEISAHVLRKAKSVAEKSLGSSVEKAVITVPASFNDLQRAATKVAARVAGLEALRILNEPTAAALAYGYTNASAQKIVVFDFGGGTFDVTLLDLSGNVFEVLATGGDPFLGGDDVDLAIVDRMAEAVLRAHRFDPRQDPQLLERLRVEAERIKITLSNLPSSTVEIHAPSVAPGGKDLSFNFSMTRGDLEALLGPLVDRAVEVCRGALSTARLSPGDFEQVLLVGGSTRIPLVKRRVAEFFGKDPLQHRSPEEVVALGAAIQAMALASADRKRTDSNRDPRRPATLGGLGEHASDAKNKSISPQDPRAKTNPGVAPNDVTKTQPGVATAGPMTTRGVAPAPARLLDGSRGASSPPKAPDPIPDFNAPSTADFGRKTPAFGLPVMAPGTSAGDDTDASDWSIPGVGAADLPLVSSAGLPSPAGAGLPSAREASKPGVRLPGTSGSQAAIKLSQGSQPKITPAKMGDRGGFSTKPSVAHEAQQAMASVVAEPSEPTIPRMVRPTALSAGAAAKQAQAITQPEMPKAPAPAAPQAITQPELPKPTPAAPGQMFPQGAPAATPGTGDASVMDMLPLVDKMGLNPRASFASIPPLDLPPAPPPAPPSPVLPVAPPAPVAARGAAQPPPPPPIPIAQQVTQPRGQVTAAQKAALQATAPSFGNEKPSADATAPIGALPTAPPPPVAVAPLPFGGSTPPPPVAQPFPTAPPPQVAQPSYTPPPAQPIFEPFGSAPPPPVAPAVGAAAMGAAGGFLAQLAGTQDGPANAPTVAGQPAPYTPPTRGAGQTQVLAAVSLPSTPPPPQSQANFDRPLSFNIGANSISSPNLPMQGGMDVLLAALCLETVSGYCDVLIPRNTAIPCERQVDYVTARNNQTGVKVRIAQGNSPRFAENAILGEVVLNGVTPAARGEATITVIISVARDGVVSIRARDMTSGQEVTHQVPLPRSVAA